MNTRIEENESKDPLDLLIGLAEQVASYMIPFQPQLLTREQFIEACMSFYEECIADVDYRLKIHYISEDDAKVERRILEQTLAQYRKMLETNGLEDEFTDEESDQATFDLYFMWLKGAITAFKNYEPDHFDSILGVLSLGWQKYDRITFKRQGRQRSPLLEKAEERLFNGDSWEEVLEWFVEAATKDAHSHAKNAPSREVLEKRLREGIRYREKKRREWQRGAGQASQEEDE